MQIMKNSFGMEFVLIPAGSFMMGSDDRDPWAEKIEKPRHRVTISRSFWLGRYPVTMGDSARVEDGSSRNSEPGWQCPVKTTWYGVQNFIETLNAREDTAAYRLPTEAEWEYAARAGSTTRYFSGDDVETLREYAWWYKDNWDETVRVGCQYPVGLKKPNPWGLYDMLGTCPEWVADCYAPDYYAYSPELDPKGWRPETVVRGADMYSIEELIAAGVVKRVVRGQLFPYAENLRCAQRWGCVERHWGCGFRVARSVDEAEQ